MLYVSIFVTRVESWLRNEKVEQWLHTSVLKLEEPRNVVVVRKSWALVKIAPARVAAGFVKSFQALLP